MDRASQELGLRNFFSLSETQSKTLFSLIQTTEITIVGCGASGSLIAQLLLRTGFKSFKLIDGDVVEEKNLSRQFFSSQQKNTPKVKALKEELERIDNEVICKLHPLMISSANYSKLLFGSSIIIECSDSFSTKKLISHYALEKKLPWIYTGVLGDELLISSFDSKNLDSFSLVFSHEKGEDKGCDNSLILSSIASLASFVQIECIRLLLNERGRLIKMKLMDGKLEILTL